MLYFLHEIPFLWSIIAVFSLSILCICDGEQEKSWILLQPFEAGNEKTRISCLFEVLSEYQLFQSGEWLYWGCKSTSTILQSDLFDFSLAFWLLNSWKYNLPNSHSKIQSFSSSPFTKVVYKKTKRQNKRTQYINYNIFFLVF